MRVLGSGGLQSAGGPGLPVVAQAALLGRAGCHSPDLAEPGDLKPGCNINLFALVSFQLVAWAASLSPMIQSPLLRFGGALNGAWSWHLSKLGSQ